MIKMHFAISEGRGEDAGREAEKLGRKLTHFDSEGFRHDLTQIIAAVSSFALILRILFSGYRRS